MSLSYRFPDEILQQIFKFCDIYTLLQLNSVCIQYYRVSQEILTKKSDCLLFTNETSEKFRKRCKPLLSSYNSKFMTYYNWKNNIYKKKENNNEYFLCNLNNCFYTLRRGLELTRNTIWFYAYKDFYTYNRAEDGNIKGDMVIAAHCDFPISSVAYCDDMIISGHSNGSIRHWRIKSCDNMCNYLQQLNHFKIYDHRVSNIEVTTQHMISSSENFIRIQKNRFEEDGSAEENKIILQKDKWIRSISLDPTKTKFAVCANQKLFLIYDINGNQIDNRIYDNNFGRTYNQIRYKDNICLQLLWQDPHTIFMMCCHDIKKLDTRTSKFVRIWDASPQNRLRNISSDYSYTMMTGTNNSIIIQWDQRTSNFLQQYYVYPTNYRVRNPVLSMQFDSTHMYTITPQNGFTEFDFKGVDVYNRTRRKKHFINFS